MLKVERRKRSREEKITKEKRKEKGIRKRE